MTGTSSLRAIAAACDPKRGKGVACHPRLDQPRWLNGGRGLVRKAPALERDRRGSRGLVRAVQERQAPPRAHIVALT